MGLWDGKGDRLSRRRVAGGRRSWLCLCVALLSVYPPALSAFEQGLAAPFRFFAADAFYYFAVAKHARTSWAPSFDGVLPSNGFHPLWQAVLSLAARAFELSEVDLVWTGFWLSVGAATAGSVLFSLAVLRVTQSFWWALFATVPGFFYWAFGSLDPHYYSSWAFASGMESGLSCLFLGALAWWLEKERAAAGQGRWLIPSLLVTGLVLARLDDVFYLIGVSAYAFARGRERPRLMVIRVGAIPACVLAIYLATNWAYAG